MNKSKSYVLAAAALAAAIHCAAAAPRHHTTVVWENAGNDSTTYIQRITVKGDMTFDRLAFNMLHRGMQPVDPADTITVLVPGYYTLASPRFVSGADSVVVEIVTKGTMANCSYAPDGWHRVEPDGGTSPVEYIRRPLTRPTQWSAPGGPDRMPYADHWYEVNENVSGGEAGVYDVIPSYKDIVYTGGTVTASMPQVIRQIGADPGSRPGQYSISVTPEAVTVKAADEATLNRALNTFLKQVLLPALTNPGTVLPCAVITDWPDHEYRGLMIDVCRNFQPIDELKRVVDYMSEYRMNVLHLHALDDEAWRIEIEALPELTSYAGRRGYSPGESECLYQLYSGDGDPESTTGASNGYYTRAQMIDFLQYAWDRGVAVIPEVESPGHARAAIKAMEKRYRDTGDDTYRLIIDGDTSEFTSAQNYHDNVMNPAVEGTYLFLGTVFDAIKDMYAEAGVPLPAIHIGGDEVARGAWDGSEAAQELIRTKGLDGQTGLHGYFVERVAAMLADRGIPMSGWQEIAVGHTPRYNAAMAPLTYSVNCWTQSNPDPARSFPARAVSAGFPVVLSNVNHFYMDMCYSHHPEEPGLKWGGTVDEFTSLHGYPADLCPVSPDSLPGSITGVSGHLFAETLRSPRMLEQYLFPKMLGLAERSWNAAPTYADADYNAVVDREIGRWAREGRAFHLRQPGAKVIDGRIHMNSPYAGAVIRYTTDGSEPTAESPVYTAPIPAKGVKEVRLRLYHHGAESVTSVLYPGR